MASSQANPLVDQGTLNRIRAAIQIPSLPSLNITAPFLGREMISLALNGESVTMIPTGTGQVTSPQPYIPVVITAHLLRTQALAAAYKAQMEQDSKLGLVVVTPDSSALPPYQLQNCAIEGVRELSMAGNDAGYIVTIAGYYLINSNLWNLS